MKINIRRPRLSLRLKILTVTGIPVLALIVSTTTFLLMIASENRAEDAARKSVAIRQEAAEVDSAFQAVNGAIWGEAFGFGTASSLPSAQADLGLHLKRLRELAANDEQSMTLLNDFESKVSKQIEISRGFVAEIARTGRLPKISGDTLANAEALIDSPDRILQRIARNAENSVASNTAKAEQARDRVVTVVVAAGAVGVTGGLALMVFAITGVVRRIRRLGENARRLAAGEPLLPFVYASDEVGMLGVELEETSRLLAERAEGLRRATEEAEKANLAKSEFLSRMSHELRTPLNSILGFGQILEMTDPSDERIEDVRHILRAGRHLLLLIDEVLDISGIEAGQVRFSMEPVCLEDVFEEVVSLTKPIAEKSVIAVTSMPASHAWVRADRQRLKQVLLNLVANGIKYNRPNGTVGMTFAVEGDTVRVDVRDTGKGLSPEDIDRLFVPFERLGADRESIEGTGLGLALSKRLVEGMGGLITVRSEIGAGSVFSVELPLAEVTAPAADEDHAIDVEGHDQPVVLYIEDNLANLKLIERLLGRSPVQLISAMQGTLGIDLATQHRPDVILLDLHLPDVPGDEVLRRLRLDPRTADIPVIVISADATPNNVMRSMNPAAYLTKPLDVAEFLSVFETTLSARSVA